MGLMANAVALPMIERQVLRNLETHFIAPEIYGRDDVVARQAKVARIISNNIIPRLLKLHNEVIPDASPVASLIETFAPAARI